MMIPDNAVIILSDERPFIAVGKDSDGRLKIVSSYIVLASLGKGRFGEVMLGVDETSGVRVALKCVDKAAINSLVDAEQAALEYKILSSLNHRNVMKVFTVRILFKLFTLYCILTAADATTTVVSIYCIIYENNTSYGIVSSIFVTASRDAGTLHHCI
jgi:serine/threonine protein kinase